MEVIDIVSSEVKKGMEPEVKDEFSEACEQFEEETCSNVTKGHTKGETKQSTCKIM